MGLIQDNGNVSFNIEWIDNKKPEDFSYFKIFNLNIVNIDFIQIGNTTLCTVGDSQTWWPKAQNLRRFINTKNNDLIFLAMVMKEWVVTILKKVLERISKIPVADFILY